MLSVGTYRIQGRDTIYQVVDESLKAGFRSIGICIHWRTFNNYLLDYICIPNAFSLYYVQTQL